MIYYRNDVRRSGVDGRALVSTAEKLLTAAGESGASLSLSIVSDATIRELNREHRGKDKPTDVLSFPLGPPDDRAGTERLLGDVVISVETARRQAAEYDAPLQRELYRLLIHGLLHVMGHDHEIARERQIMEREERRLADAIGMPWPYEVAG
ncbi:MAG: rRNA maturation RNase YbeY [Candidatus Eremiobacteraeota bacterium]|nr:rRNA maturation RNase YbeY [Candidatus Eremiobacteraeota bacterium]